MIILIKNGHVKTMAGPDLECGDVLIENGKIKEVGTGLTAPEGATVIDAAGRIVAPGFIDAHCHIGLDNEGMGWEGMTITRSSIPARPSCAASTRSTPSTRPL